jgi:hypothetical protein
MPKSKRKSQSYKRRSRSWSPSAIRRGPKRIIVPKKYKPSYGRTLVFEGVYAQTQGGLTIDDLIQNARNKVVSQRQHENGLNFQKKFNWRDQPAFIENINGGTRTSRRKSAKKSRRRQRPSANLSSSPTVVMPSKTAKKPIKYGK